MVQIPKALATLALTTLMTTATAIGTATAEPGPDGRYYGSLAAGDLGDRFQVTWALNYPNWADSDNSALSRCESSTCTVLARFVDGCGSIAQHNHRLLGGVGPTRADAERAALDAFGPPDPISLSAGNPPASIAHTECTGNAG
ncbi:DUF4189 domain-containing protein [Nocardia yamanashiensis]|uniref:DUF4189 domain-containing protein n=1 Tax=Nocardia yamanashiensis TaxID=209247 RepID=UPI00083162DB|nr:DUF4189 domain-containing protein [Nocardia yamanashiensis]